MCRLNPITRLRMTQDHDSRLQMSQNRDYFIIHSSYQATHSVRNKTNTTQNTPKSSFERTGKQDSIQTSNANGDHMKTRKSI